MSTQDIQAFTKRYSGNVAKLLTLGRPNVNPRKELSYREDLGIDESDTEQLLQLADDIDIYHYVYGDVSDDEAKEFFGVIHAWKALSELAVPEAKTLFQNLILAIDDSLVFDDWILVEFRKLMVPYRAGMFAESVKIIEDENINEWIRIEYLELVRDMLDHGEAGVAEVNPLLAKLFASCQVSTINAFVIGICTDNHLTEHYDAIAQCYDKGLVDIDHLGDLEDVEIAFGMRTERETEKELTETQKQWQAVMQSVDKMPDYDEPTPMPFVNEEEKVGRNDPCPCGSGKKYKKCCMSK